MVPMGPVEWLRYKDKPRGVHTDVSKVRDFLSIFLNFFKGSPTASGTQNPAIQWKPVPSRTQAHSQHLVTTSSKVGILTFQLCYNTLRQNLREYLENLKYDYRT